ncbi:hypothetical protein AB5N19_02886 [Seiridium cardinale]
MADARSSSESRVRRRAAARRIEAERIAKIRDQVKKHFTTNYHLKFDRYVGDGSHGGTGVFTALNPQSRGPIETEKYILKFSLGTLPNGEDSDEHLRNEASWLGYLSGSEHFIKSLYVNHLEVGNATGNGGGSGNAGGSGGSGSSPGGNSGGSSGSGAGGNSARSPGSGLGGDPADTSGLAADLSGLSIEVPARTRGHSDDDDDDDEHDIIPALILEYLPMGDLETLRERLVAYGKPVPSRLLWGFALCLMRMCVGLAYYDFMEPGRQEEVPGGAVKPSTLCHNSIKGPNILLDGLRPDGEHNLTPLLKLIDFGRTGLVSEPREDYADGYGVYSNMFYMGSIIQTLASIDVPLVPGLSWIPRHMTWSWVNARDPDRVVVTTRAHQGFCTNRRINVDLRLFVANLMSVHRDELDPDVRPTLRDALNTCRHFVRMPLHEMFRYSPPDGEADEDIQRFVAEVVLNAHPPPPPLAP